MIRTSPRWSSITGGHDTRSMSAKTVTPTPNEGIRHTRPLLAYVIIKTLGSDWDGSQKLVELSEQAPPFADKLLHKLSRIHKDTAAECRRAASLFPIEPTTYKHQLTELYTAFVREAEKVGHSENPGMLTTFIAFTVELCRWCIEKEHSIDVLSIHEYTCRLISESDTPCTPNEWEQYIDNIPSSSRLQRKTSMWDVILMSLRAYDEYSRYTSWLFLIWIVTIDTFHVRCLFMSGRSYLYVAQVCVCAVFSDHKKREHSIKIYELEELTKFNNISNNFTKWRYSELE